MVGANAWGEKEIVYREVAALESAVRTPVDDVDHTLERRNALLAHLG